MEFQEFVAVSHGIWQTAPRNLVKFAAENCGPYRWLLAGENTYKEALERLEAWLFPAIHSSDWTLSCVTSADSLVSVIRSSHSLGRSLLLNQYDASPHHLHMYTQRRQSSVKPIPARYVLCTVTMVRLGKQSNHNPISIHVHPSTCVAEWDAEAATTRYSLVLVVSLMVVSLMVACLPSTLHGGPTDCVLAWILILVMC